MRKIQILLILILFGKLMFGQKTVRTEVKYGVKNSELAEIFEFQNIAIQKFDFKSPEINGKYYKTFIKEFKNGKLIDKKILFDGTELEYFKINSTDFSFKIFTETSKNKLKIQLRTEKYAGSKKDFELIENNSKYVTKDFFGNKRKIKNPLNKEFPLLAIITPTKQNNGISSYCKVVQSEIRPEKLGEYFKIPHYFLITMEFK
ncbi:hypothetical protein G1K66_12210 [Tenacibaculum finnmarkense]|uniref:hypothetical protein n=2 Tax=Tenacibaculum finnmarkense TaxID=2781243 RepID=UPI00187B4DD4|nr:hypothetical protein [Tenacibaculum finnmarkense]MBE7649279.1 hypothetical protein [Tenacibaculum finnmarkense genomovar ulcerans]MCG8786432.1 hypothetical protein [Tenacibaculum finnmarkense]MCG8796607.1 hypothetical protein [Tenacibaculum finnmarkense]MCG8798923.1 hypothetical protein [Tenacibaculum finnmarkense]MCG8814019.1 hypothetical protein [Tenacibaculum finnmarkense]